MGVRQAVAQGFLPFGDALPQAVQGAINVWYDVYANVVFFTIGKRRPAYHRWIGEGIALRFDEETHKCVGFALIVGMQYDHDVIVPLWATILMMSDAITVNAKID
jgi:hypothetical protein